MAESLIAPFGGPPPRPVPIGRARKPTAPNAEPPPAAPSDPLARGLGALAKYALRGGDLLAEADVPARWFWGGLIQQTDVVELAALSTSGKSSLCALLAVAAAGSEPVELLDHEVTPIDDGKRVMLVNVEQERSSIKRKLLASCAMLGRDPKATLDRILVIPRSTFSARGDAWDAFKDLAKRKAFGLIVLDPRSRILRTGDANDEGAEAKVAEVIAELAELAACPIVIVSHLRKASGRDGRPTIEDISGSNQRGAAADVILALQATRGENDEVAASTLRCLKLRDDGGEEHPAAVRWAITREGDSVSLVVGDGAEAAPATKGGHLQLVELLRAKGALTARQLRDELNCSSTTLDRWITVAFAERRIKKDKKKHRGVERTVFMARAAAGEADRLASEARARPDRMTSGEAG